MLRKYIVIPAAIALLSAGTIGQMPVSGASASYSVQTGKNEPHGIAYDRLLDELEQFRTINEYTIKTIVNKLLQYKGYPANIVPVHISNSAQNASKSIEKFSAASFDFFTGNLNINRSTISEDRIQTIIAVLAHELDHFDKIACIYKSLGADGFQKLFTDNGESAPNMQFWARAAYYADTNNFNSDLYASALKRFLTQKYLEHSSSYSDFYRLAENIRNPLEISAYKESDYVYNHFNMQVIEGDMKRMARVFDEIDRTLYSFSKSEPVLMQERTALFDYFFASAINSIMPAYKSEFIICDTQKNGDLTDFWLKFEYKFSDFYKTGSMMPQSKENMTAVLKRTLELAKAGITPAETEKALKYKINTLKSNLVYPGALTHLRKTSINYLRYLKQTGIKNPEQELNTIIILICIDNKIYENSGRFYPDSLKLPAEFLNLYSSRNRNSSLDFIYNNPEFGARTVSIPGSNLDKLTGLINKSKLKVTPAGAVIL